MCCLMGNRSFLGRLYSWNRKISSALQSFHQINTFCSGNEVCEVSASCKHCNVSCWAIFRKMRTQLPFNYHLATFFAMLCYCIVVDLWLGFMKTSWTEYIIDRGNYIFIIEVLRILKFQYIELLLAHLYCKYILGQVIRVNGLFCPNMTLHMVTDLFYNMFFILLERFI